MNYQILSTIPKHSCLRNTQFDSIVCEIKSRLGDFLDINVASSVIRIRAS